MARISKQMAECNDEKRRQKLHEEKAETKKRLPLWVFAAGKIDTTTRVCFGREVAQMWRKQEAIHLNGLYMADFDDIDDPQKVWSMLAKKNQTERTEKESLTYAKELCEKYGIVFAHITPSGRGLRMVCKYHNLDWNIADHQQWLAKELGLKADEACKDSARASYACPRENILHIELETLLTYQADEYEARHGESYRQGNSQPTLGVGDGSNGNAVPAGGDAVQQGGAQENGNAADEAASDESISIEQNEQGQYTYDGIPYNEIAAEDDLEGACLVLMEASTGAIRAMVNLYRDGAATDFEEVSNLAIGRAIEPGSVFKTVTLMQVLSDGYVKSLEELIPTNHGIIKGAKGVPQDVHMLDHERVHQTNTISVIDGFKISSNYVFGTLAVSNYGKKPMRFVENIHSYKLGEAFAFDLDGLATPIIPSPNDKNRYWSPSDLAVMGYGYGIRVTPMHVLSFYNAIANKGKMMKPYLVEDIELNGVVKNKRGPALMSTICSRAVADTLTRALKAVTEEGTARRLKDARCQVAGKTGTSFGTYSGGSYRDELGRRKYQGTFVGFFPADDPRYSVICSVFSKPTSKQFQGGGIPARAIKNLVNGIYCIDPCFQPTLSESK